MGWIYFDDLHPVVGKQNIIPGNGKGLFACACQGKVDLSHHVVLIQGTGIFSESTHPDVHPLVCRFQNLHLDGKVLGLQGHGKGHLKILLPCEHQPEETDNPE